jgi:hypothetical protein
MLILASSIYYLWDRKHLHLLSRQLAGPFGWPIIGSGLHFTGGNDRK